MTKGGLKGTRTTWIEGAQCARNDKECAYFTYMELGEDDLPWKGEEPWKEYNIDGLKDASDEWVDVVFQALPGRHRNTRRSWISHGQQLCFSGFRRYFNALSYAMLMFARRERRVI